MGQKVNPTGFRIGLYHEWTSKWYADKKDFANFGLEGLQPKQRCRPISMSDYKRKKRKSIINL
jgi:hypothetical protein